MRRILGKLIALAAMLLGLNFAAQAQHSIEADTTIAFDQEVDVQPSFPGGRVELERFVAENLVYPENGMGGNVYVSFTIAADGTVLEPRPVRGPGGSLSVEAVRIVSMMPRWSPAIYEGKAVAVQCTLAIFFDIYKNRQAHQNWQAPREDVMRSPGSSTPMQRTETESWRMSR